MNAAAFRHFYDYHFAVNRMLWHFIGQLAPEQFTAEMTYSQGSVCDQIIHLLIVDDLWFSELRGVEPPEPPSPSSDDDREIIRAYGDSVEQRVRAYLADLRDDMLFTRPIVDPEEDKDLIVWQVLLHVVNHGTDHRAQLLRTLNDLGLETPPQDYIFYVYDPSVYGGS